MGICKLERNNRLLQYAVPDKETRGCHSNAIHAKSKHQCWNQLQYDNTQLEQL